MKKILTNLMAALVAVGLIAFMGCGTEEDPNAATNAAKEWVPDTTGDEEEEDDPEPGNVSKGVKDTDEDETPPDK